MRKSKYSEEQIIGFLKQAEAGIAVAEICRKGGFSDATFYKWRARFGGMEVPDEFKSCACWKFVSGMRGPSRRTRCARRDGDSGARVAVPVVAVRNP